MGSAIGLGNLWGFPYITYAYGGGAFLIPWMIGLIVLGIPWLIVEYGMGRYFQSRGVRIIGPVSQWVMITTWAFLIILVIRGLTLPGAVEGLNYYLTPNFAALGNSEVWFAAFSQIAFILSLGMAGMYAYGSIHAAGGK